MDFPTNVFFWFELTYSSRNSGSASKYAVGGGLEVSWLVLSTPERAVWVQALSRDIVFLGKAFTLTVPLSTQVYKWVPTNLMLGENPAMD